LEIREVTPRGLDGWAFDRSVEACHKDVAVSTHGDIFGGVLGFHAMSVPDHVNPSARSTFVEIPVLPFFFLGLLLPAAVLKRPPRHARSMPGMW
jgi:hypothetical protein